MVLHDPLGALILHPKSVGRVQNAGDVRIDAQRRRCRRVFDEPGVAADSKAEPPPVDLDDGVGIAR